MVIIWRMVCRNATWAVGGLACSSRPHRSLRKTALNATDKASVFMTAQVA
ncbi:hypothetical protein [Moraxella catarrhalis]|nr:hypothetical protein [Moraxella catarrhalis]MCG6833367.1 hypothetical protein [Moraxella catarrhalis]